MKSATNEMDNSFDVQFPWIIEEGTEFALIVNDRRLLGSGKYFIRFDVYPSYAPSHLKRHHGFWDLPLKYIKREGTSLSLKHGELIVKSGWRAVRLRPVWKGNLEFIGYSMFHTSLWDFSKDPPEQLTIKSSPHIIKSGKRDLPLEHVFLPLTQRCNLTCPMCMRHNPKKWDASDASPEILRSVFEASPFFHSVVTGGTGEVLLYENLYEVIRELKKRMPGNSQLGLTTNGLLMTENATSRLIDMDVDWITFSVDGATEPTYERIRIGSNFDAVVKNIAGTVHYRNASGHKRLLLQANYVIHEQNVHEIPAFARLAASLGLDAVTFSHLRDFKTGEFSMCAEEVLRPLFKQAAEIGEGYGLKMIFPRIHPLQESKCLFMQSAYLWLSGEVVPCCRMLEGAYPGAIRTFGNVRKDSLLDIWNSTEYREFRHKVLTRDFPEECRGCTYTTGLLS